MSAFEDFVQQELPKRGYLNSDVAQETIIIRRGAGPRQFDAVTLGEGEVLAKVGGSVEHGDDLKVMAGGLLAKADGTGDDNVVAVAEQDGSANDLIYVHIVKFVK